jgi:hypothetical protein
MTNKWIWIAFLTLYLVAMLRVFGLAYTTETIVENDKTYTVYKYDDVGEYADMQAKQEQVQIGLYTIGYMAMGAWGWSQKNIYGFAAGCIFVGLGLTEFNNWLTYRW